MKRAAAASVSVATLLLATKLAAWLVTGSVAILSSLIDSLLDVAASAINLVAVRHALVPADAEHRFGHGKAEAIAGLMQATIVAASALFLVYQAVQRLIVPQNLQHTGIGIAVMLGAIVLTAALIFYQSRVVRRTGSLAIAADSVHFRSDLLTNLGVIAALVLSTMFDLPRADAIIALMIAAYVGLSAWKIWLRSIDNIMDRELPDDERGRIRDIVLAHPEAMGIHDLRTRSSGSNSFIQFHVEVATSCSLVEAHRISDEIEDAVSTAFPDAEVIIHADPYGIQEQRLDFGKA